MIDLICLKLGRISGSSFQQSFISCKMAGSVSVSLPRLTAGRKGGLSHLATRGMISGSFLAFNGHIVYIFCEHLQASCSLYKTVYRAKAPLESRCWNCRRRLFVCLAKAGPPFSGFPGLSTVYLEFWSLEDEIIGEAAKPLASFKGSLILNNP